MRDFLESIIIAGEDLYEHHPHESYVNHVEDFYLDFTTKSALFFKKLQDDPLNLKEIFEAINIQGFDEDQLNEVLMLLKKARNYFDAPINHSDMFWNDIHPFITALSKSKFDGGFYADAVESALKEINNTVKVKYKEKSGLELDGASLMNTAFSVKNPVFVFDNIETETGRNIQQGYMQIFSGAMIGIRNPKAHDNMHPDKTKTIHLLFIASFMALKLDEMGIL